MNHLPMLLAASAILAGGCAMTPATSGSASVSGAMRVGNQPPPALRVCAMPVAGGSSRCINTPAGATSYRIDGLAAGRYYLVGWAQGGELRMVAHAQTIRCIRAPCPPDALIAVDVASGAAVTGVDLGAPYTEIPSGWPQEPAA
jgi:hypothetical protein